VRIRYAHDNRGPWIHYTVPEARLRGRGRVYIDDQARDSRKHPDVHLGPTRQHYVFDLPACARSRWDVAVWTYTQGDIHRRLYLTPYAH
jgi:hypothetical protein